MRIHILKTINPYFKEVWALNKSFEVRENDRGFAVGDVLRLKEWDHELNWILDTHLFWTFCLLGCAMLVMPGKEAPKPKRVSAPKQAGKPAKRKAKGRNAAKPRKATKAKKQKEKGWYVAPLWTPEMDRLWLDYQIKRNVVKST